MLHATDRGLACPIGGFHIDPWKPVERAVITHGHTDHAHWGCRSYLCTPTSAPILRARLGEAITLQTLPYGERLRLGGVTISFHPAGHVLGSAQVRIEADNTSQILFPADTSSEHARVPAHAVKARILVVTGDYKIHSDPTSEPFEPVPGGCDVFITESTFGLPIYRWPDPALVRDEINHWWAANIAQAKTSVIFAYALGKAQRVLAGLDPALGPILVHGAIAKMNPCYEVCGIRLPRTDPANVDEAKRFKGRAIVIAPPSAQNTPWMRKFAPLATATASGWMRIRGARRRLSNDRGFVLSDHADWPGLLRAIEASGAHTIGVTHGQTHALTRWLREKGRAAHIVPTRYRGEEDEPEAGNGTPADSSQLPDPRPPIPDA